MSKASFTSRIRKAGIQKIFAASLIFLSVLSITTARGATTGTTKWSSATSGKVSSSPAISYDGTMLFVGSEDNNFYAFTITTGGKKWSYTTTASIVSSPVVGSDGMVYIGSTDKTLRAFKPDGSTVKWTLTLGGAIVSTPALASDGTLIVGCNDFKVYAFDSTTGTQKWTYLTGGEVQSSPIIGADGVIYVGSNDKNLYALNANGTRKWSYTTNGIITAAPALAADGTIYVGSGDHTLYAINPNSTLKWTFPTAGNIFSTPAVAVDKTIYVGSNDGSLYAIKPNGEEKWSTDLKTPIYSSPAVGLDGIIYVGTNGGGVYALDPADGTHVWSYPTGASVRSSPVIGTDGTLYIGSDTYSVYAINVSSLGLAESAWPMFQLNARHTAQAPTFIDLVVSAVSNPPATTSSKATFNVTDTTTNQGNTTSGTSVTRYYFSTTNAWSSTAKLLSGTRAVPALTTGESSTGEVTVTVPSNIAVGQYYLVACADDTGTNTETDEDNNCLASTTMVNLTQPDLVVSSVNDPPAATSAGSKFQVTDTTLNQGIVATPAQTTTRYYLSLAATKSSQSKILKGTRAVPVLDAGASSTGTVEATVPNGITEGSYYLIACANDTRTVEETDYTNNCTASAGKTLIAKADLVETSISDPPGYTKRKDTFKVTDTIKNQGGTVSKSSVTQFYFSTTATKDATALLLKGKRSVGSVKPNISITKTTSVSIPVTVPFGTYYLIACADDTNKNDEESKANNCLASTGTTILTTPDLVESVVSDPPATIARKGRFTVTDTVLNQGHVKADKSTTRYYLSTTGIKNGAKLLSGKRSVAALDPGATSTGTVKVTVPSDTPVGTYYLLACADDMTKVEEEVDDNNCKASSTTVEVQ